MKHFTIRTRVTFWYTGLLVLLLLLGELYLLSFMGGLSDRELREALLDVVADTVKEVHFDHGKLDDSNVDYYKNGVSIFFYDTQGRLLAPKVNRGIQVDSILEDGAIKTAQGIGESWLVHDLYAVRDNTGFWIRGVISFSGSLKAIRQLRLLMLVGLPMLVIVSATGGWLITRRAFAPVKKMARTARAISYGSDLSLRVADDRSGDELSQIGSAVNSMLGRLQSAFEHERQFSSDVSHELRTPTAIILSQCEFALSDAASDADKQEALHACLRQAKRMSAMISQLLLLARAENGRFSPNWEQTDLSALCEMCLLELEGQAEEQHISLISEISAEVLLVADQTLLIRLLTNLLSNAIRYNRPSGWVRLSLKKQENGCVLQVEDSGIGISPEQLPKIWNRFFRADASRSVEGTGLGLSMVQWIVQLHGGTIDVWSVPDHGSCFTVFLPNLPAGAKEAGATNIL